MTHSAPMDLPLPLGYGCTPNHAVAGAPGTWRAVAERLARDGEQYRNLVEAGDQPGSKRLAHLLLRSAPNVPPAAVRSPWVTAAQVGGPRRSWRP